MVMSKWELIDLIKEINTTAKTDFLDTFSVEELDDYLENLLSIDLEALALCA